MGIKFKGRHADATAPANGTIKERELVLNTFEPALYTSSDGTDIVKISEPEKAGRVYKDTITYAIGDIVTGLGANSGKLYRCTTNTIAGIWTDNSWIQIDIGGIRYVGGTDYVVGDIVSDNDDQDNVYVCVTNDPASATVPNNNLNWKRVEGEDEIGGKAFSNYVDYTIGDVVTYNNETFRCINPNLGGFIPTDWETLELPEIGGKLWLVNTKYVIGDIVSIDEDSYVSQTNHTSDALNIPTIANLNWSQVARGKIYKSNTAYIAGDIVTDDLDFNAYISLSGDSTQPSTSPSDWKRVSKDGLYSDSISYEIGDIVSYDNQAYINKTPIVLGGEVWNPAKWEKADKAGSAWETGISYNSGDIVVDDDIIPRKVYVSLAPANLGNLPNSSPAEWQELDTIFYVATGFNSGDINGDGIVDNPNMHCPWDSTSGDTVGAPVTPNTLGEYPDTTRGDIVGAKWFINGLGYNLAGDRNMYTFTTGHLVGASVGDGDNITWMSGASGLPHLGAENWLLSKMPVTVAEKGGLAYRSAAYYHIGDIVVESNLAYKCKVDSTGHQPSSTPSSWELLDSATFLSLTDTPANYDLAKTGFIARQNASNDGIELVDPSTMASDISLGDLNGVPTPSSPANDNQHLEFNGATWDFVAGTKVLGDLEDVTDSGAAEGDILQHDGTDFKNVSIVDFGNTIKLEDLSDVPASLADGNILEWDATSSAWLSVQPTQAADQTTVNDGTATNVYITPETLANSTVFSDKVDNSTTLTGEDAIQIDGLNIATDLSTDRTITHQTGTGYKHIPVDGISGDILEWDQDGTAKWAAPAAGFADPLTTDGDIIAQVSGSTTRLPVGSSNQVLSTNTTGDGIEWIDVTDGVTDLSEGITTLSSVDINSSTGTNVTLVEADTSRAGILSGAKFDEIVANTAKETNVTTDLTNTPSSTEVTINSSDGTDTSIVAATTTDAGIMTAADKTKLDNALVSVSMSDISNTDITAPNVDEVLTWDGANWVSMVPAGGEHYESGITPTNDTDDYPDTSSSTAGAYWIVTGIDAAGYTYTDGDLNGTTVYNGDQLLFDGTTLATIAAVSTNWGGIAGTLDSQTDLWNSLKGREYVTTVNYLVGDLCSESGTAYRCTVDTSGVFVPGNWESIELKADLSNTPSASDVQIGITNGNNTTISAATNTAAGIMTAADKDKLDAIDASANDYTHPTHSGDNINVDTTVLSGATVISDLDLSVTTDAEGHVTSASGAVTTRELTATDINLGNVDNTSDANKPVSSDVQTAIDSKADKATSITTSGSILSGGGSLASDRNITHNTGPGFNHIPSGGAAGEILTNATSGEATWSPAPTGETNLGLSNRTADTLDITSSTGNNVTIPASTTTQAGLMTESQFDKLFGVAVNANLYVHPTTSGNRHIPAGGATGDTLVWTANGTAVWGAAAADERGGVGYDTSMDYYAGDIIGIVDPSLPAPLDSEMRTWVCINNHTAGTWASKKSNWSDTADGGTY